MQEKRLRETASWSAFVPLAFSPRLRSPLHYYLHRTSGTGVSGLTKPEWNIHRYTASTPNIYLRILKITTGYYHLQFCLLAVLIMLFWLDICCHSNLQHTLAIKHVASFPGRSHFQYLITYSMQIRRGKAWEIWSRAVTSGRQKVDTRGAVPDKESRRPFLYNRSEGWRPER